MRTYAQAKEFAQQQHRDAAPALVEPVPDVLPAVRRGTTVRRLRPRGVQQHRRRSTGTQTSPPPPGSIAYYGSPDRGAGHAVFAVNGGFVWSNDILRRGRIDRVRWDVFENRWNLPYRGWIDACPAGELPVQRGKDQPRLPAGEAGLPQQDAASGRTTRTASGTSR